jgi:hypothetical protein
LVYWWSSPSQFQWLFGHVTGFNMAADTIALSGLAVAALVLMVAFTGGVAYLTIVEWRDRRRRAREQRNR